MRRHVAGADLALFISGDLNFWRKVQVRLHLRGCEPCRMLAEVFRSDQAQLHSVISEMPEGVDWDRLAAEMTANIRVGLAAGECVAPRSRKITALGWRPAAAIAGLCVLLAGGWWLNIPPAQTQALGHAMQALWRGRPIILEERGPMVQASSSGVELRENGNTLTISQGTSARPVAVSVSAQGSASARYVDADTGQMTITSVYVQ